MGNYYRENYHRTERQWPRVQAPRGQYVGVELEVSHRQGYQHLLDILPDPPTEAVRPATECDGSLPDRTGVEIVFPAFEYSEARRADGFLAQTMGALRANRATHGERYGMHLNVNTVGWRREKKRSFCALINWLPPTFLVNMGGRALNMYCEQRRYVNFGTYDEGADGGRGAATARENRIECRFPRSTSDHARFALMVDFLNLCERYVNSKTNQDRLAGSFKYGVVLGAKAVEKNFVSWLSRIKTDNAARVKEVLLNGYR